MFRNFCFRAVGLGLVALLTPFDSSIARAEPEVKDGSLQIVLGGTATVLKQPVRPGTKKIQLVNVLPAAQYLVESELHEATVQIPAPLSAGLDALLSRGSSPCDEQLARLVKGTKDATTERQIAELNATLASELEKAQCKPEDAKAARAAFDAATVRVVPGEFEIQDGEDLVVTITRSAGNGAAAQPFGPFTFATKRRPAGNWLALYGFNYVQNGDELFFAKTNPDTTPQTYTVTALADRRDKDFSPSVYFMWVKEKNYSNRAARLLSWNHGDVFGGLTAGIGFDFDKPTTFLGYGIGWGYNVMITGGVAIHSEKRLNGRYSAGDQTKENLSEGQLTEETYKPRVFVGLAFRFGSNPFKKGTPKLETATSSD